MAAADDEFSYRRFHTQSAYENYGATSLRHWSRRSAAYWTGNEIQHLASVYHRLSTTHVNFEDRRQAAATLQPMERDRVAMNAGVPKVLAQYALVRVETDALLLAVKIHELKLRQPDDWQQAAERIVNSHPYLKLERHGGQYEIRLDDSHPVAAFAGNSKRSYASVPVADAE